MPRAPAEVTVPGWAEAVEAYFERGWTDGLPVVPATAEAVRPFLEAAGRAADRRQERLHGLGGGRHHRQAVAPASLEVRLDGLRPAGDGDLSSGTRHDDLLREEYVHAEVLPT